MSDLTSQKCEPCRIGAPKVTESEIALLKPQVPEWQILERDGVSRLERIFDFDDFAQALDFTTRVGELAEREGHHPVILTEWGGVTVSWWTHKIDGLHRNDFIMAARTDEIHLGDTIESKGPVR
jgi:4a-hydroxytetrahydrobiopterin dehydratase